MSPITFGNETAALVSLEDFSGARAVVDADPRRIPKHFGALRTGLQFAVRAHDRRGVRQYMAALDQNGSLDADLINSWVWFDVMEGTVHDLTLERVHSAVRLSGTPDSGLLHTQATVYAETHQLREARDVLAQYVDATLQSEPDGSAPDVLRPHGGEVRPRLRRTRVLRAREQRERSEGSSERLLRPGDKRIAALGATRQEVARSDTRAAKLSARAVRAVTRTTHVPVTALAFGGGCEKFECAPAHPAA